MVQLTTLAFAKPSDMRLSAPIALLAAIVASLGDVGLLWAVNSGRGALGLALPPVWLVTVSTLAGALALPLYGLGYRARARCVAPCPRGRVVARGGALLGGLGAVTHTTLGVLIQSGSMPRGVTPMEGVLRAGLPLVALWCVTGTAFIIVASADMATSKKHAEWPFNPLVVAAALTGFAVFLPPLWAAFLGPAAFNLGHVAFFARVLATEHAAETRGSLQRDLRSESP